MDPEPTQTYKHLALSYFRGTISSSDEKVLHEWVKADDRNLRQLHAWEKEWNASPEAEDAGRQWTALLGRVAVREALEEGERQARRKPAAWAYAAACLAVLATAVLLWTFRSSEPAQVYAMEAPAGEKCRLTLPDSTVVWLNSGSKLTFSDSFNRKERRVALSGEGFFDVTPDPDRPFTVDCTEASVLVKGTQFNVSAYAEETHISVSVLKGLVEFYRGPAHLSLKAGQSARYDILTKAFSRTREKPADASAWTESRFVYDNITLSELAEKLSRTYAVLFHFNTTDHLNDKFNISLRNNETLPEVLTALERIIPVKTRIEGDNVYIEKK